MKEYKELFDLCQKNELFYEDIILAKSLVCNPSQTNFQDKDTGKTPLMVLLENRFECVRERLIYIILQKNTIDFSLCDNENKNTVHYLMHCGIHTIKYFPWDIDLATLFLKKDNQGIEPWTQLKYDLSVIEWFSKNQLWETVCSEEVNLLESFVIEELSQIEKCSKVKIASYYKSLDAFFNDPWINTDKKREPVEKYFLSNTNILILLIEKALENDAIRVFKYFIDFIRNNKLERQIPPNRPWTIITVHYPNPMFQWILDFFGDEYFTMSDEKGRNVAHIASHNNNLSALDCIFKKYGKRYFVMPDQYGRYPLHYATSEEVLLYFNQLSVPFNAVDNEGNSVLHRLFGVKQQEEDIDFSLLPFLFKESELDLAKVNTKGESAFDIALQCNRIKDLKKIFLYFKKYFHKEQINAFMDSAMKMGCIDLINEMIYIFNLKKIPEKISLFIHHKNKKIITSISNQFSLSDLCHEMEVDTMRHAMTVISDKYHAIGQDFHCFVLHVDEMVSLEEKINTHLKLIKRSDFNYGYLITDITHWIGGEISVKNFQIKNILIMDPMVYYDPMQKMYDEFSKIFPESVIYISSFEKQKKDYFCPFYCLVDIEDLGKVRRYLPEKYNKDLYLYLDAHPMKTRLLDKMKNLRTCDIFCDLPGLLKRTGRSLNGGTNSYRERRVVSWIASLQTEEIEKFSSEKKRKCSLQQDMEKYINCDVLNKIIENKIIKKRQRIVGFFSRSQEETPPKKQFISGDTHRNI